MTGSRRKAALGWLSPARRGEAGFTLLEILAALGIIAAAAVVFLLGITTTSQAVMTSQERVTIDSLAKSQLERIKSVTYDETNIPPDYEASKLSPIPPEYNITISAQRWDPLNDTTSTDDTGLQKITVTVTHEDTTFILEGYKLKPG